MLRTRGPPRLAKSVSYSLSTSDGSTLASALVATLSEQHAVRMAHRAFGAGVELGASTQPGGERDALRGHQAPQRHARGLWQAPSQHWQKPAARTGQSRAEHRGQSDAGNPHSAI